LNRVVLKIYSNVSGGGGAPDITIYMEGTDDSRAAVRIPTSVITKKIFDADGDTYITVEETADEDKMHFYIAGTKRLTIEGGDTSWHEVGTGGEPAFQWSWVNVGGNIKDGEIGADKEIFYLPIGYRPPKDEFFPTMSNGAFGWVKVRSDGKVVARLGNNAGFSLCGITFYAG